MLPRQAVTHSRALAHPTLQAASRIFPAPLTSLVPPINPPHAEIQIQTPNPSLHIASERKAEPTAPSRRSSSQGEARDGGDGRRRSGGGGAAVGGGRRRAPRAGRWAGHGARGQRRRPQRPALERQVPPRIPAPHPQGKQIYLVFYFFLVIRSISCLLFLEEKPKLAAMRPCCKNLIVFPLFVPRLGTKLTIETPRVVKIVKSLGPGFTTIIYKEVGEAFFP